MEEQLDSLTSMLQEALKTNSQDSLPTAHSNEGSSETSSQASSSCCADSAAEGNGGPPPLPPPSYRGARVTSDSGTESMPDAPSPLPEGTEILRPHATSHPIPLSPYHPLLSYHTTLIHTPLPLIPYHTTPTHTPSPWYHATPTHTPSPTPPLLVGRSVFQLTESMPDAPSPLPEGTEILRPHATSHPIPLSPYHPLLSYHTTLIHTPLPLIPYHTTPTHTPSPWYHATPTHTPPPTPPLLVGRSVFQLTESMPDAPSPPPEGTATLRPHTNPHPIPPSPYHSPPSHTHTIHHTDPPSPSYFTTPTHTNTPTPLIPYLYHTHPPPLQPPHTIPPSLHSPHTMPYHTIPPPPIPPPLPYIPCWWGGQLFWMLFVKFAPPAPTEPSLGYVYPAKIVSPPPTHADYGSCVWAYRFVQWPLSRGDRITGQEPRLPGMSCFLGVCWLVASAPPLPPTDDWQTCLPRFQESSNLPHPLPAGPATRCPGTPPWSTARRSRGPPRGAPGRSRPRTTRHYPCRYQKLSNGPCRKGPLRPRLPMRRSHTAGGTRCARGHWAPGRRNSSMTCCNCGLNLASCGSCRVGRRESLPAVSRLPWSR